MNIAAHRMAVFGEFSNITAHNKNIFSECSLNSAAHRMAIVNECS